MQTPPRLESSSAGAGALGLAVDDRRAGRGAGFAARDAREREPGREHESVATSPNQLELTFDENVEISFGSIALFDQKGDRIDIGAPHHSATSDHSIEATRARTSTTARTC